MFFLSKHKYHFFIYISVLFIDVSGPIKAYQKSSSFIWCNVMMRAIKQSMNDINDVFHQKAYEQCRKTYRYESHSDRHCQYHHLYEWVIGHIPIKVLIRRCFCRSYLDRKAYLKREELRPEELGNGVEVHFDDRCTFEIPNYPDEEGYINFRKICYCYSAVQSNIR